LALLQKHYKWYIERERKTEKLKEQVNRWMGPLADGQTDKQTDEQTEQTFGQRRMMDRQAEEMIWWADGQTERKTELTDSL
jgi:hypothetical protein